MFKRQLHEKYLHLGLVCPTLCHIPSEYGDLLCKAPYSVQMCERNYTRKKLQTRTLSTQWLGFVVYKLQFVFVSTLRDKLISLV